MAIALLVALVLVGGASPAGRAVGGTPISISAAPWAVAIDYGNDVEHDDCTGSIISPSLVVTSAFCLYSSSGSIEPLAGLTVIAGVSNDVTPASTDAEQSRTLSSVRIPSDFTYNPNASQADNVAVLTLSAPLNLGGPDVQSIALPSQGATFPAGASASMPTYGQQSASTNETGQLESMTVSIEPQGDCGQPASDQFIQYNATVFCAVSPTAGVCDGDAGASLVATSGSPVLLGVASGSSSDCTAGSQGYFTDVASGEILDFLQGTNSPPVAPQSSKADPTDLVWYGPLNPGVDLVCTTGGWGGGVRVAYSFVNAASGQVLQSGSSARYVIPPAAVGETIECISAVTNAGGTTLERTSASSVVKASTSGQSQCHITQSKSLRSSVATKIEFVNETAKPVKLYWLSYVGKRVYYSEILSGRSLIQPTYDSDAWIVINPAGTCVGYVVAPHAKYAITS